jgi:transposase
MGLEAADMKRKHMNHIRDILQRLRLGESERQIARDMGIARKTVRKYHALAKEKGFLEEASTRPDEQVLKEALGPGVLPPKQVSTVEPYREKVLDWVKQGVEMTAIWQRLQENYGYLGGYSSVRRFVRRLQPGEPEAYIRVHSEAGEDLQVDFGSVGQLYDPASGRLRPAYVFVATLCYSRHQYAELVFDQKMSTWLALHRRAFEFFGGVPKRVIPDNLKAAVKQALVYDPVLAEAYRRMALHYGFLISPTRPGTPRHKGKVENGVHYVQRNFMAGQDFVDIDCANQHLKKWITDRAGVRKHGTTGEAPLRLFAQIEQACLQPLPAEAFRLQEIRLVKVHPDCHVVIDGSFYSVPFQHIGKQLSAHVSDTFIEIYQADVLLTTHPRSSQPGQWQTRLEDYPPSKAAYLIHTPQYCRQQAQAIGPSTLKVVERLLSDRPLDRLRSVQAILKLEESLGPKRLEGACARALFFGDVRYRQIKQILNAALDTEPLPESVPSQPILGHVFARSAEEFFQRHSC